MKDDGCSQNEMKDGRRNVWVCGFSPFFVGDDLLVA
jgi:hypothetical protein